MKTAAWMVGREGGVVELRFDAPEPPFEIVKELVFRDDAEQIAQAYSASLTRKLELMSELAEQKERYRVLYAVNNRNAELAETHAAMLQAEIAELLEYKAMYGGLCK